MSPTQVAFAADVFTWPSDDRSSSAGAACRAVDVPRAGVLRPLRLVEVEQHLLPRRGLWTFTTQEFLPKEPYASGETHGDVHALRRRAWCSWVTRSGSRAGSTESDAAELRIGMEVELVVVPFRVEDDGTEVMTYAFAAGRGPLMDDVAVIGVGLHPFGRFGASRPSTWAPTPSVPRSSTPGRVDATCSSPSAGASRSTTPTPSPSRFGPDRHPVHGRLQRLRDGGDRAAAHRRCHPSGQYDIGVAVGMDKHEPGAFTSDPVDYAAPPGTASRATS